MSFQRVIHQLLCLQFPGISVALSVYERPQFRGRIRKEFLMKLQLIGRPVPGESGPRLMPVNHFKKCPACGCAELIESKPDVLCTECNWDSTAWDVSRGGMDNLYSAAKEFGIPVMESSIAKSSDCPAHKALSAATNQPTRAVEGA